MLSGLDFSIAVSYSDGPLDRGAEIASCNHQQVSVPIREKEKEEEKDQGLVDISPR